MILLTLGWDHAGDPTHHEGAKRDRSCAFRMLEMHRVVMWFTSHRRADSHTHEKVGPGSLTLLRLYCLDVCMLPSNVVGRLA